MSAAVIDLTEEEESLKKRKTQPAKSRQSKDRQNVKSLNTGLLTLLTIMW